MKTSAFLLALALLAAAHLACNPKCESLQAVRVTGNASQPGHEILITAEPLSSLRNRQVSFGNTPAEAVFHEDFGLVVKVPADVTGDVELKIEDPDCLDFVTVPFSVQGSGYFETNPDYVPPAVPFIVIPTVNINPPTFVDNAWLSPENPYYCLWFTMKVHPDSPSTKIINPFMSFEQATCPCLRDYSTSHLLYAQNPMYGIVDKENNRIELTIDRTAVGAGFESYTGRFIDMKQVDGYAMGWDTTVNCFHPSDCVTPIHFPTGPLGHMMLLTSTKTGRQLTVYQKNP